MQKIVTLWKKDSLIGCVHVIELSFFLTYLNAETGSG